ncbi:MAG TPA: hypothetical protein VII38_14290 [Polyangia bacterium]|jgi:hypothetical protein
MRALAPVGVAVLVGFAFGCGAGAPPSEMVVTPAEYDAQAMTETPLEDGASIDLVRPPQGGFVLFVGALVKNLEEKTVVIDGQLADASGALVSEDKRTVTMMASASDPTLFQPDLRSYTGVANIAVCPSTSPTDRYNLPFQLTLVVTEPGSGRTGTGKITVTPSCRQTDPTELALCQCECAGNYSLGKCGSGTP